MKQHDAERLIKQRVVLALNDCKISVSSLARFCDVSQTTLNDQVNGKSKISAATLLALADFRQDLSAEWLLRGNGDMLANEKEPDTQTPESVTIQALKQTIAAKDELLQSYRERIAELKGAVDAQQRSSAVSA